MAWSAKGILASPFVFDVFQSLVGAPGCHREFLTAYVRPRSGEHLLDIGCGVGATLLRLPPDVFYTGLDISAAYIKTARARFGERATFICADVSSVNLEQGRFDCAIAFGVLHHLDDPTAHSLLRLARSALAPGRRLFTIDPCYTPDQSRFIRFLISRDRGRFVRDVVGYQRLFNAYGVSEAKVVDNLLHFPYTHLVAAVEFS